MTTPASTAHLLARQEDLGAPELHRLHADFFIGAHAVMDWPLLSHSSYFPPFN